MLNRLIRFTMLGFLAAAVGGYGVTAAYADDNNVGSSVVDDDDDDTGDDDAGDDDVAGDDDTGDEDGDTGDGDGDDDGDGATDPSGGTAAAAAGKGMAGVQIQLPSGFDDKMDIGFGGYVELNLWGKYELNDKASVGVEASVMAVKEDLGPLEAETLQMIAVTGKYQVNDLIHARGALGLAPQGRFLRNPWGGVGFPGFFGDQKIGVKVGAGVDKAVMDGKVMVKAGVDLVFQLDSDVDSSGDESALTTAHIPVWVMYGLNEQVHAGVMTGVYLGSDFDTDPDKGMTLPLMLGGKYAVNETIDAFATAGLASVVTPDGVDATDTLSVSVGAMYKF